MPVSIESSISGAQSRKVLGLKKTASLVRDSDHSCAQVDSEIALTKMDARIFMSFQRFLWAEQANCLTSRGSTKYNGSVAHCKRQCEAAHASFTPNMTDDMLESIGNKLEERGVELLSSFDKKYLMQRFGISEKELESKPGLVRKWINEIPKAQKERSLDQSIESLRNSTFNNPTSSNRVDSRLEKQMRPLEDNLALACASEEVTPEEAMAIFSEEYIEVLAEMQEGVEVTKAQFDRFVELEETLFSSEAEHEKRYDAFIDEAREFLFLRKELMKNTSVGATVQKAIRFFHNKSVYLPLESLVENYDQNSREDALEYYSMVKGRFAKIERKADVGLIKIDLANRLSETQLQLDALVESHEKIPRFRTFYYGVKDSATSERRAPTREEIQEQFLSHLDKIS